MLNRKVDPSRLGHTFSVHGIAGSLGWALVPAMLVPLTIHYGWRTALICAGVLAFSLLLFGTLMDHHRPAAVWVGIDLAQGVLIVGALNLSKARRSPVAAAVA